MTTGPRATPEVLRDGARRLLAQAIEAEAAARNDDRAHLTDDAGRRQVVRNGHLPGRRAAGVERARRANSGHPDDEGASSRAIR